MTDQDITRASLLLRLKNSTDQSAWADFDAIYRPMLYRFAQASRLRESDADDMVQFCMTKILEHIKGFDYDPKKGRFKGWLRTMVNNRVRNLYRAKREHQALTQDYQRVEDQQPTPEEVFDKLWMEEHLRHALHLVRQEVEEVSYQAYECHVVNGLSVAEVCEAFKLNANQLYTLKWRLNNRVREKMKMLVVDGE